MKQGIDALRGLKYKLRIISIPISGPSHIYGDIMSVLCHISRLESVLRKKRFAITQYMNQLQWMSPLLEIYLAKSMLQI